MSPRRSLTHIIASLCALLSVAALVAPAGASAHQNAWPHPGSGSGYTSLTLNGTTAGVLTGDLGLSVTPIAPATQTGLTFNFPIDGSATATAHTGLIRHSGGIAISGGGTTVALRNFWIDPMQWTLSANVSETMGGMTTSLGRVTIVTLDPSTTPISAFLNSTALGALGGAFGVNLGSNPLLLGTATVNFR